MPLYYDYRAAALPPCMHGDVVRSRQDERGYVKYESAKVDMIQLYVEVPDSWGRGRSPEGGGVGAARGRETRAYSYTRAQVVIR